MQSGSQYLNLDNRIIAVIGLGYVRLPLAVEFGKNCSVIGYDMKRSRIEALMSGHSAIKNHVFCDLKHVFPAGDIDLRL